MRATLWLFLLLPLVLSSCGGGGDDLSSTSNVPAKGISAKMSAQAADSCGTEVITVGVGPGIEIPATDVAIPDLPDFITRKTWLETPWGFETYKYGWPETITMKAQFENIGIGSCPSVDGEINTIKAHFYLSKGYKEDAHSGDNAWKLVGTDEVQCTNLKPSDTHTETESMVIARDIVSPGIWNIVACIDHPETDHNNGGNHREKHESNNCSTEAVFEVTSDGQGVNVPEVDFTTESFQFLQTPYYAGDQARFGGYVKNIGNATPPADIRTGYAVSCNGGTPTLLTDDSGRASDLSPNASHWEETQNPVTLPNVAGTCTAYFCADYQEAVSESDETNNCSSLDFTLQPRPAPNLVITQFQDEKGCCTTNTGDHVWPNIWVRNIGPIAPSADVTVIYQISSPVATGGAWWNIGSGVIHPSELPPGGTDEDYMDNSWTVPKNSSWKLQWHTVRGCLRADGSYPTGNPNQGDICATYGRYSKK